MVSRDHVSLDAARFLPLDNQALGAAHVGLDTRARSSRETNWATVGIVPPSPLGEGEHRAMSRWPYPGWSHLARRGCVA